MKLLPRDASKTTLLRHLYGNARYALLEDPDFQARRAAIRAPFWRNCEPLWFLMRFKHPRAIQLSQT